MYTQNVISYFSLPPSSSESVSESSLSPHVVFLSAAELHCHTMTAVSAPPVDTSSLSSADQRTLVTWAEWPTYRLCLANFPWNIWYHDNQWKWRQFSLYQVSYVCRHFNMLYSKFFKHQILVVNILIFNVNHPITININVEKIFIHTVLIEHTEIHIPRFHFWL